MLHRPVAAGKGFKQIDLDVDADIGLDSLRQIDLDVAGDRDTLETSYDSRHEWCFGLIWDR